MNKEKLNNIENIINELKIVDYVEDKIDSDSNFISLKVGEYTLNNGNKIRRESVYKKGGGYGGVAMFAIDTDKNILLVIQPRAALPTDTKVCVEIPAGYIENGEDILVAARRELLEETGYSALEVVELDKYYPSLGCSGEFTHIVLAMGCTKVSEQHLDKDEFVEYISVSLDEFEYLLDNGYILDATARLSYYRVMEYLTKNNKLDIIGR